ncbi:MAG: Trk system potassium transporter TrkA, partial [Candidatus Thermoplasmatota archaeon]
EALDILVVKGNAGSPETLISAGIERADWYIGATGSDEVNLVSCAFAKSEKCKTLARVESSDYLNEPTSKSKFKYSGVDIALCSPLLTSMKIVRSLLTPTLLDADIFAKGKVQVLEVTVDKSAPAANKTLKELKLPKSCMIVAIMRNGDVLIPSVGEPLLPNDSVVITLGNPELIPSLESVIGGRRELVEEAEGLKRVIIVGATRTGVHIAKLLEKSVSVTLIDDNKELCDKASAELANAVVIHGSPVERELLVEEGVPGVDAFIASTAKDETNMLSALLAKELGARRIIALIDKSELRADLATVGIDIAISPTLATIGTILQYVRKSEVLTFKVLKEGEAQVLEFKVLDNSQVVGKKLKDAKLPKNSIIGAIVRNDNVIVPTGTDELHIDDKVIIFAKTDAIPKLERLF